MELWFAIQLVATAGFGLSAWLLGRLQGRGNAAGAVDMLRLALGISGLEMYQEKYSIQDLAEMAASRITMLEAERWGSTRTD